MELQMKIYSPYERKEKIVYISWGQVSKAYLDLLKKIDGEYNSPKRFSFIELKAECEFWQSDVSDFIKSLGIKNDEGFSGGRMFHLKSLKTRSEKSYSSGTVVDFLYGKELENDEKEGLKLALRDKYDILKIIRDNNADQMVSKEKVFDYVDGQYYLNGKIIHPSKTALYYVLFDATYSITQGCGDVLYSTLKTYLVENKVRYIKDKRYRSFGRSNETELKNQVTNNLLNGKGFLNLRKISKYLKDDDQKHNLFTSTKNGEGYTFNNKQ